MKTKTIKPSIKSLTEWAIYAGIAIIVCSIFSGIVDNYYLLLVVAIISGIFLIYQTYYIETLTYEVTGSELIKRGGVINLFNHSLGVHKITDVCLKRNLLDRILGLSKIDIQTAGTNETEMSLWGLPKEIAKEANDLIKGIVRNAK